MQPEDFLVMWHDMVGCRRITLSWSIYKMTILLLDASFLYVMVRGLCSHISSLHHPSNFVVSFPLIASMFSFPSTIVSILVFSYHFCWPKPTYICWKFCRVTTNLWPGIYIFFCIKSFVSIFYLFILFIFMEIHCNISRKRHIRWKFWQNNYLTFFKYITSSLYKFISECFFIVLSSWII